MVSTIASKRFILSKDNKDRICFECGKRLYRSEFIEANPTIPLKNLLKIWESNHVELYCCECNKEIKRYYRRIEQEKKYKEDMKKTIQTTIQLYWK
jgi:hypothetical protein